MATRTRGYYRQVRADTIARKQRLSAGYWHVRSPGMLSKGKIHCSCWMCSNKSVFRGRPVSEQRKYHSVEEDIAFSI